MRAEYGYSGWEISTNVRSSSTPASTSSSRSAARPASPTWDAPSNFNAQPFTYKRRCVITRTSSARSMPTASVWATAKYAIMGLSSGGGAALTIAAQNRRTSDRAASLSGYNWMTAPGMHRDPAVDV